MLNLGHFSKGTASAPVPRWSPALAGGSAPRNPPGALLLKALFSEERHWRKFGWGAVVPRKSAFSLRFKGTSQRRAAAVPSGPLLGSWPIPTTGTLPKATPRAASGRFLRRSFELLREPHGILHWVQNRTALIGRLIGDSIGRLIRGLNGRLNGRFNGRLNCL